MIRIFLSCLIGGMVTLISNFVVRFFAERLPIPAQVYNKKVIYILIISILVSSSVFSYYKLSVVHTEPSQPNATREAARILALEALRQGSILSVTVSKLPKHEEVYQAAKKLLEISPRYQEKVSTAEASLNDVKDKSRISLINYLNKVVELGRYKPEYITFALDSIQNGDLTPRERIVAVLLTDHVASLRNGIHADPVQWLSEFTKRFSDFVD